MSLTAEGVLFVIGALFLIVGLAGSVELTAVKIPSVGKLQRLVAFGIGSVLIPAGIFIALSGQTPENPQDQRDAQVEPEKAPVADVSTPAESQPAANEPARQRVTIKPNSH